MSTTPSLRERLEDADESVRAFAAEDAGFDDRGEDVPALVDRLRTEASCFVRGVLVTALARMHQDGVIDQAVLLLGSGDAYLRNAGVSLLQTRGVEAAPRMRIAFVAGDADVRKLLLDAASAVPGDEAVSVLLLGKDDPDINVRIASTEYLGERARPELKGHFEALVRTEREPMLLAAALSALEEIGDAASWAVISERSAAPGGLPPFLSPQVLRILEKCGAASARGARS